MASQLSLDSLPPEVVETIVSMLDFADVCALRLTGTLVSAKASQCRFTSWFSRKRIELTSKAQLDDFVRMTERNQVGCLLEHLTLVYVLPPLGDDAETSKPKQDAQVVVWCLTLAFKNILVHSEHSRLQSLTLKVERDGDDLTDGTWRNPKSFGNKELIWASAAWTFETACLALDTSRLPINQFNIFDGAKRGSLACDQLAKTMNVVEVPMAMKNLRCLSLSLSERMHNLDSQGFEFVTSANHHIQHLCRFLQCFPGLESLEIHWFNYSRNRISAMERERRFFDLVAESVKLPHLLCLSLKGVYTCEAALTKFLSNTPLLHSLTLEGLHLQEGTFHRIFDMVLPQLDYLRLDDLFAPSLIDFDLPGEPHFPSTGAKKGPNELTRCGPEARRSIKYRTFSGRGMGSQRYNQWLYMRLLKYGI
ncbi:hypothetical protein K461DRAFT_269396 [Myriangium duriaei CBS 260.36]|uniref:F-box domain-containing protein n=1 Tax=Myriangium duriaei CBS 260.36 TaxID=1168546 RepID=A0A9P4IY89_9PEZI|nr:hypothetical protein K461DRAFT_269396 [Myriangium duriaei CBS 260.36]